MASNSNFYYQRLKQEILFDDEEDNIIRKVIERSLRRSRFRKVHIRKKLRVKIPRIKRLLRGKTSLVKIAWTKVCKRLKESQAHFGDLFAGNYMFMQVTPTPLKWADNYNNYNNGGFNFLKVHDFDGLSYNPRYSVPS